jgi:uncharacterized membrane protein YbhN (UPF0104 family)
MARWLKNLLGIAIIALLLWYLAKHWESLKHLVNLKPSTILYLYIVSALNSIVGSYTIQHLLATFGIRPGFWEMFHLNNTTTLLNYLPAKFGTFYRANYLKRHYGLIYAHFGVLFLYLILLMTMAAAIIGLFVLVTVYGLAKTETALLATIFIATLAFFAFLAFVPLPAIKGSGKLSTNLRNFAAGRSQMTANKLDLFVNMLLTAGCFVLSSIRIGIIYHSMGQLVHPAGYLVLGAVAYVTMFISITPGSLGLRELALALGAVALGVDFNVGSLAAVIDRGIALVWSFTAGAASTIYLWHKFPQDFKKNTPHSAPANL